VEVKGRDKEGEEVINKPLHKKNPDVGEKPMVFSSKLLMEQEDAASFGDNEEVSRGRLHGVRLRVQWG
jgi:glutamyl-tRNA synthetase